MEKDLTLKKAPESAHEAYAKLKELCQQKGWKLKVQAPKALEIGIKKILKSK